MADQPAPLAVQSLREGSSVVLTLSGDLDMAGIASFWKAASKAFQKGSGALIIDASGLKACDGAGIAVLLDLKRRQAQRGQGFEIRGFPQAYQPLFSISWTQRMRPIPNRRSRARHGFVEEVGDATAHVYRDARDLVAFVGEASAILATSLIHPHRIHEGCLSHLRKSWGERGPYRVPCRIPFGSHPRLSDRHPLAAIRGTCSWPASWP